MRNFGTLIKSIYNITTEKLWNKNSQKEKAQLFKLLFFAIIVLVLAATNQIFSTKQNSEIYCLICNIAIILVAIGAVFFLLRGKTNLFFYLIFTVPLFVYGYFISDFSQHPPLDETIYLSVWWLVAGLIFLFYFSESKTLAFFYFILSFFTLGLQLTQTHYSLNDLLSRENLISNPLGIILITYFVLVVFRIKYSSLVLALSEKLKETNQKINKIFQDSSVYSVQIKSEIDEEGNITKWLIEKVNNAFESKFNINLYQVENQEVDYIFNLLFRDNFDVNNFLFFQKKKTIEFYAKNIEKWFRVTNLKLAPNQFFLLFEDISKIKFQIESLTESRNKYKVLLETIPDIYAVIDKDGTYEDFVIKEGDLFKVEDSDIIGSTIFEVGYSNKMAARILILINNCISKGSLETIEYSLNTPHGTLIFEMRMARLNSRAVVAISRDITSRKNIQFKLSKALKKAEESDKLKSAFLANLSHEIRTPLNIITNFSQMMTDPILEENEKYKLADDIAQNSQQLLNMIDNTIHLSKIETNTVIVNMNFCRINELLREIYNHFMPLIPDSKNVRLQLKADVQTKDFGFITDEGLLKEVLSIFIDNGIKYTLFGNVIFGFEMIRNEAVKFFVSDTGIGISEEESEYIFSRFYRIKNKINETTSGSGIGLPIAQHYILLLDGELKMETKPDKGTTFSFVLPFKKGKGFMTIVN